MRIIDTVTYFEEIVCLCEEALEAIGQLNYTLLNLYQVPAESNQCEAIKAEIFAIIDVFLTNCSLLSRMLWLDKIDEPHAHCKEIPHYLLDNRNFTLSSCSTLRKSLGTSNRQLMKTLLKNDRFDMFPVHQDGQTQEQPGALCIIGSLIAVTKYSLKQILLIYDPMTRNLHANDQVYPLQEMASVVTKLQFLARLERIKEMKLWTTGLHYPIHHDGISCIEGFPSY
ncbi:MAG: hypothetical protein JW902_01800 [Syntrophaceae bacterium]|nr:hypothetical protein [Syntrophaceae bacterium]